MVNEHPTESDLRKFASGELDDTHFEEVAAHLEHCDQCADVLRKTGAFKNPIAQSDQLRAEASGLRESADDPSAAMPSERLALTADLSSSKHGIAESAGSRVGPYKLLQELGHGGMGVVYMAEQERPVRRMVALKIIKPGMDSQQVIARFEAERQALAMMDHHNIAKVLDAGTTDTGRPYFAMELVKGVPMTDYCDKNKLTPRERLEMFIPVCHAIQHAHQKGIIHRDIKPSNVLVTLYDGKPVPKVIDFGIAKATRQKLTERTMFTGIGQILGTFEYMSPEQAEMNQLDIDTRSDVYSLGVMLYELLTGSTPITKEKLRDVGLEEMLRTIRETEPPKPSTRLSDSTDALPSISAVRKTEPAKLSKLVRGDLDWIVMKALEKDRTRRYETANGLAADVQRFLADEAVEACPPSTGYRFRKFARRNKTALATGITVAGILVAATILSSTLAVWAWRAEKVAILREQEATASALAEQQAREDEQKQRRLAEENAAKATREATKSSEVATFLKDMLKGVGPSVALDRDTTMLTEILAATVDRIDDGLAGQPAVRAELYETLGEVYSSLNQREKSKTMFEEALEACQQAHGDQNADVARMLRHLTSAHNSLLNYSEAERIGKEALALSKKYHDATSSEVVDAYIVVTGNARMERKRAEEILTKQLAIHDRDKVFNKGTMLLLYNLANDRSHYDYPKCIDITERIVDEHIRLSGEKHKDVVDALSLLSFRYRQANEFSKAENALVRATRIAETLEESDALLAEVEFSHGELKFELFEDAQAETLLSRAIGRIERMPTNASTSSKKQLLPYAMRTLSQVRHRNGDYVGAIETGERALELAQKLRKSPGELNRLFNSLAHLYVFSGQPAKAEAILRDRVANALETFGERHHQVLIAKIDLGNFLGYQRRYQEAESVLRDARRIERIVHQSVGNRAWGDNFRFVLVENGRTEEAEQVTLELVESGDAKSFEHFALSAAWDEKRDSQDEIATDFIKRANERASTETASGSNTTVSISSELRRVARSILLNPTSSRQLVDRAAELAQKSVETKTPHTASQMALGIAKYRQQDYIAADKWLQNSRPIKSGKYGDIQIVSSCFLAMSAFQQGKMADARRLLNEARLRIASDAFVEIDARKKLTSSLKSHLAFREAQRLINGKEDDRTNLTDEQILEKALAVAAEAAKAELGHTNHIRYLTSLYLWYDREPEYEKLCREFVEYAEASTADGQTVYRRAAMAVLWSSKSDPDLVRRARKLADRAVEAADSKEQLNWAKFLVAVSEYRLGNLATAESQLAKVPVIGWGAFFTSERLLFLAMARHKLGTEEQARSDYEGAVAILPARPSKTRLTAELSARDTHGAAIWHLHDEAASVLGIPIRSELAD